MLSPSSASNIRNAFLGRQGMWYFILPKTLEEFLLCRRAGGAWTKYNLYSPRNLKAIDQELRLTIPHFIGPRQRCASLSTSIFWRRTDNYEGRPKPETCAYQANSWYMERVKRLCGGMELVGTSLNESLLCWTESDTLWLLMGYVYAEDLSCMLWRTTMSVTMDVWGLYELGTNTNTLKLWKRVLLKTGTRAVSSCRSAGTYVFRGMVRLPLMESPVCNMSRYHKFGYFDNIFI